MLPCLPGYSGPHALHVFLQQHLGLSEYKVTDNTCYTIHERGDGTHPLVPNSPFAVFVYVADSAPPAPTRVITTTSHRLSLRDIVAQQQQQQRRRNKKNSNTKPSATRVTVYVLQHSFWDRLTSALGEERVAFLLAYCIVAVQFAQNAGALQVVGPPAARHWTKLAGCKTSSNTYRKRTRRQGTTAGTHPTKRARLEGNGNESGVHSTATHIPPSLARVRLDQAVLLRQPATEYGTCRNTHICAPWLPACPASLQEAAHVALNEWWASARQHKRKYCTQDSSPTSTTTMRVSDALLEAVFPYTLQPQTSKDESVTRTHLRHVLQSVLSQCAALDVRGMALKHIHFIEARAQTRTTCESSAKEKLSTRRPGAVRQLTAPIDVVLSFLHTALFHLRYEPPVAQSSCNTCKAAAPSASFWGCSADVSAATWQSLAQLWRSWLSVRSTSTSSSLYSPTTTTYSSSKVCMGGSVVLGQCLNGVKVAQIPWLRGFFTRHEYTSGSRQHARLRRSTLQQSVFMQVVFFISHHIVPRLLHAVFHVTWDVKTPQQMVYIPHVVWQRLVRRTLRQLQRRNKATHSVQDLQVATSQRPCLYAAMRFLPDYDKLRPVACMRLGSEYALRRLCRRRNTILTVNNTQVTHHTYFTAAMSSSSSTSKNRNEARDVLRTALLCLRYEVEAQKAVALRPQQLNSSHETEYAQLLNFAEYCRNDNNTNCTCEGGHCVSLLRADAVRCYDSLCQRAVCDVVASLVKEDWYCELHFTALTTPYSSADTQHSPSTVQKHSWSCVLALSEAQLGTLPHIPPFTLLIEEEEEDNETTAMDEGREKMQRNRFTKYNRKRMRSESNTLHTLYPSRTVSEGPSVGRVISGESIRLVLNEHLQHHLVLHAGAPRVLFRQDCGIIQGSPVATLLCNVVLAKMDEALRHLLIEHDAHLLLLRRVDDLLIATTSPVAHSLCLERVRHGWPELGYRCQRRKLQHCTASGHVTWCGLILEAARCNGVAVSVEWGRAHAGLRLLTTRLIHSFTHYSVLNIPVQVCEKAAVILMRRIALRVPFTALCACINSHSRVVQTLYEVSLLWSRLWLKQVEALLVNSTTVSLRTSEQTNKVVDVLLRRPLQAAVGQLCAHVQRQHRRLQQYHESASAIVSRTALQLCMVWAMHQTLQAQLRPRLRRAQWQHRLVQDRASRVCTRRCLQQQQKCMKRDKGRLWWRLAQYAQQAAARLMQRYSERTSKDCDCKECSEVAALLLSGRGADSLCARALAALRQ